MMCLTCTVKIFCCMVAINYFIEENSLLNDVNSMFQALKVIYRHAMYTFLNSEHNNFFSLANFSIQLYIFQWNANKKRREEKRFVKNISVALVKSVFLFTFSFLTLHFNIFLWFYVLVAQN